MGQEKVSRNHQKGFIAALTLFSVLGGFGIVVTLVTALRPQPQHRPLEVAREYFWATYFRDYATTWELISDGDKAFKSYDQYLTENTLLIGVQSKLFEQFADWVEFTPISIVSSHPEQTVVWAHVRYPDLTDPAIIPLLEIAKSSDADVQALSKPLQAVYASGQLPFVEEEVSFNLVDDDGVWRVVMHWDEEVTIHLLADVHPDLPWMFYPVEPEIQVLPGETVRTSYIARNDSDQAITGKAVHEILPLEHRRYLETIQCFCFTEQTLEAGEEREMNLIFRVDFNLPQGISAFSNGYTFYTLETFPEQGGAE